jgi:hypothetical protein
VLSLSCELDASFRLPCVRDLQMNHIVLVDETDCLPEGNTR